MSRLFQGCRALMAAAARAGTKVATAPAADGPAAKPKNITGILKPLPLSAAMRKFVGATEISRTEAVKKIWVYVKLHQLQNPTNKREILCDEKLKSIFDGRDKVGMLEISRLITPHFLKSNKTD